MTVAIYLLWGGGASIHKLSAEFTAICLKNRGSIFSCRLATATNRTQGDSVGKTSWLLLQSGVREPGMKGSSEGEREGSKKRSLGGGLRLDPGSLSLSGFPFAYLKITEVR